VLNLLPTTKGIAASLALLFLLLSPYCIAESNTISSADGGVTTTIISTSETATVYKVKSKLFPANLFSKVDLDDYSYRVSRRNCNDEDILFILKHKQVFRYDFFGSDDVKVGTFYTTYALCKDTYGRR
jgi:hypothetical protein